LSEIERSELAAERQQRERDHDPPDSIERFLAREFARMEGKPDPYGTGGLSEAERRARDWDDYRDKESSMEASGEPFNPTVAKIKEDERTMYDRIHDQCILVAQEFGIWGKEQPVNRT
jgi:hypothetical protein